MLKYKLNASATFNQNHPNILTLSFFSLIRPLVFFIFQEERIQYQYKFMHLLNNLFKVGWR